MRVRGLRKYPRLIEFHNSHFYSKDLNSRFIEFVTVLDSFGNTLREFRHITSNDLWFEINTPSRRMTAGDVIKMIYNLCDKCLYLDFYFTDINPSDYQNMRLQRILRYKFSVGKCYVDYLKRKKRTYNLECADDVKVLNNLRQVMEMKWGGGIRV